MPPPTAPDPAAEPLPPVLPEWLREDLALDDLDELYPDVDGVALDGATIALPQARTIDLLRSRIRSCVLELPPECPVEARDSVLEGLDLTGRRLTGLVRTHLLRCRLSGADLSEATLENVTFEDCALDLASWRLARVRRVVVRGGRADGLDATAAQLSDLTIAGVALTGVVLERARCERVDLTDADLSGVEAVASLAGTTISAVQAVALAARLARGLGIHVAPPPDEG